MLGLGLLGVHELGAYGWRWWTVDLVWAVGAGLGVGTLCGAGVGKLVLYLRRVHREAVGLDEFLALGLIALSYGLRSSSMPTVSSRSSPPACRCGASSGAQRGRRAARRRAGRGRVEEQATDPSTAPAYMARAVLGFNEQLERLGELAVVARRRRDAGGCRNGRSPGCGWRSSCSW